VKTLIVDDEPLARERLRELLKGLPDVEIVGERGDGRAAVEAIKRLKPELVFLDVQMPGMDGFAVIEEVGAGAMPAVVFVTAYDQHAVKAFEVHAVDYLLKPFDDERFASALRRAREAVAGRGGAGDETARRLALLLAGVRGGGARKLVIKSSGRMTFLNAEDVDWVEASGNYLRLHAGSASHLMRGTLAGLEATLDPGRFCRIHRSTIVNVDRIRELQPFFHGDFVVILHDGTRLTLKRGYREHLARLIGQPL